MCKFDSCYGYVMCDIKNDIICCEFPELTPEEEAALDEHIVKLQAQFEDLDARYKELKRDS